MLSVTLYKPFLYAECRNAGCCGANISQNFIVFLFSQSVQNHLASCCIKAECFLSLRSYDVTTNNRNTQIAKRKTQIAKRNFKRVVKQIQSFRLKHCNQPNSSVDCSASFVCLHYQLPLPPSLSLSLCPSLSLSLFLLPPPALLNLQIETSVHNRLFLFYLNSDPISFSTSLYLSIYPPIYPLLYLSVIGLRCD